jgi:hypothetical protein
MVRQNGNQNRGSSQELVDADIFSEAWALGYLYKQAAKSRKMYQV